MKKINKNCKNCNNEFLAEAKYVKRGHGKFCSISCSNSFNKKSRTPPTPNVTCSYCKEDFYKKPSSLRNSKSGLYFCCREHKDLAQKLSFGLKEVHPKHYGTKSVSRPSDYRPIAFENLPNKCKKCGYDNYIEVLQVHHKDRDRSNNNVENLEILCPTCHMEEHFLKSTGMWGGV